MNGLVLCSASAGTGKTWTIGDTVLEAVAGDLDSARILGTTFTKRAASELKGRIQERLLDDARAGRTRAERLAKAERLDLALLGTVHSIGFRILQRYALTLGLSPRLRVIEEESARRAVEDALARLPLAVWEALTDAGRPLGQDPKETVLALLAAKRTNGIPDDAFFAQMAASADRLCAILGRTDPGAGDVADLYPLIERTLGALNRVTDTTDPTQKARERLKDILAKPDHAWRDVVLCAALQAGKRSGADKELNDLRFFASRVREMPRLHEQIRHYTALLAETTLAIGRAYEAYKNERGLLDYPDLEAHFLRLLEREDVAHDLRRAFDVILVDEFQDTDPIQLAIFLRLHAIVGRSLWVGDPKQAIYGFRNADPELMQAVWDSSEASERPTLTKNWRSQAGLVAVFNRLFEPVFGAGARIEPHHPAKEPAVERWLLAARNQDEDLASIAGGIAALHAEDVPLGHITVLVRTNPGLAKLGAVLRNAGIPAVAPLPGLLGTREGALALAGLRLVVDRNDGLAAAEILHLLADGADPEVSWLAERLREVRDTETARAAGDAVDPRPFAGHPVLSALEVIPSHLPPAEVLAGVLHALTLPRRVAEWGEPDRRAANLDALLALARVYEEEAATEGRAVTVAGLVRELERRIADETDLFPVPAGIEAVTLLTYHAAKGLEWPVVILTGLDAEYYPDVWNVAVTGGHPERGEPLRERAIRCWVWPFGTSGGQFPKPTRGSGLEDAALATREGQALSQAEAREARRVLYVGMTRAKDRLVLAHRPNKYAWLNRFPVDMVLAPDAAPGIHPVDGTEATYRIRHLSPDDLPAPSPLVPIPWYSDPPAIATTVVRRWASPSEASPDGAPPVGATETIGPRIPVRRLDDAEQQALGRATHAYLAALPSFNGLELSVREAVAERTLRNFGATGILPSAELVRCGEALEAWVTKTYPGATWLVEVPVTAPRPDGSRWHGFIDLALGLPDGSVAIVDHKTTPVPEAMWAKNAARFAGQVAAYREALEALGVRVVGAWVHLAYGGGMVNVGG